MRCAKCGTVYRDADTWCFKCGKPLENAAVPAGRSSAVSSRNTRGRQWEQKTITVPLQLKYIPFSTSPLEHRKFAEAYQRLIEKYLDREALEGWAVDGLAGWQSSLAHGRIKMSWWDRVQEFLGLDTSRHFIEVTIPLRRLAPVARAEEPAESAAPSANL